MNQASLPAFASRLLAWYDRAGRQQLPWRHDITAYRVWVSEIMLQQTQVSTVIPYFERFVAAFPDVRALADAEPDVVLHLWTGLGYYSRARNLQRAAQILCAQHQGLVPTDMATLASLPGIGRSTAGAIASIAGGQPAAILDGNVKRVLARHGAIPGWPGQSDVGRALWTYAEQQVPPQRCGDYSQAIMDLGALLCRRGMPDCANCPVAADCQARLDGTQAQFPGRKAPKVLPVRSVVMPLLTDPQGCVLLKRRPTVGVWASLWSLPELTSGCDPVDFALEHGGRAPVRVTALPALRHSFSHYHLDITPVRVRLTARPEGVAERDTLWYNPDSPAAVGLPAPILRLLTTASSPEDPDR